MQPIALLALAAPLLLSADALQLHKRTDGPPRVVEFPIQRAALPNTPADRLDQRQTVEVALSNQVTLYIANATVGTPAQAVRLQIDTGSSDLWFNTPSSQECQSRRSPCSLTGTYEANSSSTYSYVASDFNITYADGTGASGDYATDNFTIGGISLASLQFGIGYRSTIGQGILGVGYALLETQVASGRGPYNNLPAQMVADGLIQSNAYSLWLNDLDSSTGSILFGGVDTAKFQGELQTVPIQKVNGLFQAFFITLTDLSFGDQVVASNQSQPVLLDSGSSLTLLPDSMVEALYQALDAQFDSSQGTAFVDCNLSQNSTTLDFVFSGATISVALSELLIRAGTSTGQQLLLPNGAPACLFGISPAGNLNSVLGDTFLRSAYVVYDISNNEISLAQTVFNATDSNILEIGTGTNSVPQATPVSDPVSAQSGSNEGTLPGFTGTVAVASATSTGGAMNTAAPMKLGAIAALGAGIIYAAV
ncbi:aspartic proteinase precursor [Xylogone sp. PMI_703]|nr:aspartic proteinase precursor [Xylogone sp. PMI_703]